MQFGLWGYSFDYSRVKLDSTTLTSTSKPIHPTPTPFQQKVATKSKQHTILILYCNMLIRSPSLPHMIIHPELHVVDNSFSGFHLCLNLMRCVCKNRVYMQYTCPWNCIIQDYLPRQFWTQLKSAVNCNWNLLYLFCPSVSWRSHTGTRYTAYHPNRHWQTAGHRIMTPPPHDHHVHGRDTNIHVHVYAHEIMCLGK